MITNLQNVYNKNDEILSLLKEIEARYFYLFHDALNYDTIDDKTYEALVHLGDLINPTRLAECCKTVRHNLVQFHDYAGKEVDV